MLTFLSDNLAFILAFAGSALTGLFAYWKATRVDDRTKEAFLFGSIHKVVEAQQADNKALRERVVQLEARIAQLEERIVTLVARPH